MAARLARRGAARAALDRSIHEIFSSTSGAEAEAFGRLARHVRAASALLRPGPTSGHNDPEGLAALVGGLEALAAHHADWLRPVEAWRPSGTGPRRRFASLAHHLLARYPVPAFLTQAWFVGLEDEARRQQGWYVHLGRGQNIRTADIPLTLTRAMAHHFGQAPDHCAPRPALRWGQVRGMGGTEALARAVLRSRLAWDFGHDDFWRTVVRFFINHPRLDLGHVRTIVAYLHEQRFVPREVVLGGGMLREEGPADPDLSLRGRSVASLMRDVRAWQRRLRVEECRPALWWPRCAIGEFRHVEGDSGGPGARTWSIRQLVNSYQLRAEGHAMRHCAASYDRACARGETTVWSMRVEDVAGCRRALTIEVDPATRLIVQARRLGNAPPSSRERGLLERWARQEGLTFDP